MSFVLDGEREQRHLRELAAALDALPMKRLASGTWRTNGECCALGALILSRDPEPDSFYGATLIHFGSEFAGEVVCENDKFLATETPEDRFTRMRAWVASQIKESP